MSVSIENGEINFIAGEWRRNDASDIATVFNPATEEILARVPLADAPQVNAAVDAAAQAFPDWRRTPPAGANPVSVSVTSGCSRGMPTRSRRLLPAKTARRSPKPRAELQRGIENVEVACGIPSLMQGYNLEDVARGIDEMMIRQPIGVAARSRRSTSRR